MTRTINITITNRTISHINPIRELDGRVICGFGDAPFCVSGSHIFT